MNEIYIALPFAQLVVSLFLAAIVIFSDPRSRRNRLFVLFLVAMALWGVTIFGMRDAFPNRALAYSWERVVLAVIPFSSIFFYHFVCTYTRVQRGRWVLVAVYAGGFLSAGLSLAGQSATGMTERFYGFAPELGWAFPLVLGAAYPPVLLGMLELTRALRSVSDPGERARLRTLRLGGLISLLGGTSDFIPSLGLNVYPMGVLGNLLFAVLTTWAVTRYHLMNLRLVLRSGLAHIAISSFVFASYGAVYGLVWLLGRNLSVAATATLAVGTVIMVGVFVRPLVGRVEVLVDKLFFRERSDRVAILGELHEISKDIRDLPALTARLVETVRRATQTDWAAIMLPDRAGQRFVPVAESGSARPVYRLPRDGCIASWLEERGTVLHTEEVSSDAFLQAMSEEERTELDTCGAAVVIPLIVKRSLTGLIALGPSLVASGYSSEDIGFLTAAADQVAIALENARLYAEAQRVARERTALAEERAALAELGRVVTSTLDLEKVFERCEEQVRKLISYDRFVITTVDLEKDVLADAYVRGVEVPGWPQGHTRSLAGSPMEKVVNTAAGLIVGGRNHPERLRAARAARENVGLRSLLASPLLSNGRVIGIMILESREAGAYARQHLALAERVGAQIANAIANSQHYEQALQLAEEREARIRLDAENRQLQRVDEERSSFLSRVSHELKTPLTSLSAFTDILLRNRDGNLSPRQMQHLAAIQRGGRSLNVLINDLLDVSRIDSGNLMIDCAVFDANELVEQLDESFAPLLDERSQTLELSLPDEALWVHADRDRINQVVTNLLSNASKYSGEGSPIEMEVWGDEDRLRVEIRDHGIGISEEDQDKLFTPFFRAENEATRSAPGTGLGMVIAKGIVECHGGQMTIQSEPGQGTTVSFYIEGLTREPARLDMLDDLLERRAA